MKTVHTPSILVTGATGAQGGAVLRALRQLGLPAKALVRDLDVPAARELANRGVELSRGDLNDAASLDRALVNVKSLFSVQLSTSAETQQAHNLAQAARRAGVEHVVHSSVSGTRLQRVNETAYWEHKTSAEDAFLEAGFPAVTRLRPGWFMDNFLPPMVDRLLPDLATGEMVTAVLPETRIAMIAVSELGLVAATALTNRERFGGVELELAGDFISFPEIADVLSETLGIPVVSRHLAPEELVRRGQIPSWVEAQSWLNVVGYPARPADMERHGFTPTRFVDWAKANASALKRTIGAKRS